MEFIDLKYLRIIHLLTHNQSVTRTAKRLNISPASVSYGLKKVREITGSPLFTRTKKGMIPGTLANKLSQRYQRIVKEQTSDRGFTDAGRQQRHTTIRASSLVEFIFSFNHQKEKWYGDSCKYSFVPLQGDVQERLSDIKNNVVDVDIGPPLPISRDISRIKLFTSKIAVLTRKGHMLLDKEFTIEDWYASRHLQSSMGEDYSFSNFMMSTESRRHLAARDVVMLFGSDISMIANCAFSDNIALVPEFFLPVLLNIFPVTGFPLPAGLEMECEYYLHFSNQTPEGVDVSDIVEHVACLN